MPCYSIEGVIAVVDPSAYVHPTAVLIGDVIVGPDCYVGPNASLRGDFGRIVLQRGSNVQDTLIGGVPAKLLRPLREEETALKLEGTRTYQELTRRCLASLQPVEPL